MVRVFDIPKQSAFPQNVLVQIDVCNSVANSISPSESCTVTVTPPARNYPSPENSVYFSKVVDVPKTQLKPACSLHATAVYIRSSSKCPFAHVGGNFRWRGKSEVKYFRYRGRTCSVAYHMRHPEPC
jgi:hypothetical protein